MATENEAGLRVIFSEICKGYSKVNLGKSEVFIKHFSHFEQSDIEQQRDFFFEDAKSKSIPTQKQKSEWLVKEGLWSGEEDIKIRDLTEYGKNLVKNKDKAAIKIQIDEYKKLIVENEKALGELINRKRNLIGMTCEGYADSRIDGMYPFFAIFKDEQCKTNLFTRKQYDRLDDEELIELVELYTKHLIKFSIENIRKISISNFFTSYFYLSEDIHKFFNKPLYSLTFNQVNLISYGSYFRSILSSFGDSIPKDMSNDPDKIEEFAKRKKSGAAIAKNGKGNGRTAVIGATEKDDAAYLGGVKDDTLSKGEIDTAFEAINSGKLKINR